MFPEGGLPGTRVVHGDRSFASHDADFVLFDLTAGEIRWLQSGVVVPHVTVRPLRRTDICRLRALAQEGSGMSLAFRGTTCVAPGQLDVDAPSSSPVCDRLHRFLFVEDRTAVHEAGGSQGSAP